MCLLSSPTSFCSYFFYFFLFILIFFFSHFSPSLSFSFFFLLFSYSYLCFPFHPFLLHTFSSFISSQPLFFSTLNFSYFLHYLRNSTTHLLSSFHHPPTPPTPSPTHSTYSITHPLHLLHHPSTPPTATEPHSNDSKYQ